MFLDELPEFKRDALEALRQPLEDKQISIARANAKVTYPANIMLVASMNPCPCGNFGRTDVPCRCTPREIKRYLSRISGPLLDRIDMHIGMDAVSYTELTDERQGESGRTRTGGRCPAHSAAALPGRRYSQQRIADRRDDGYILCDDTGVQRLDEDSVYHAVAERPGDVAC